MVKKSSKTSFLISFLVGILLGISLSNLFFVDTFVLNQQSHLLRDTSEIPEKILKIDSSNFGHVIIIPDSIANYSLYIKIPDSNSEQSSVNFLKLKEFIEEQELISDMQLIKMCKGLIAYEIPDTMEIEKFYKITALVSKTLKDSILFKNFKKENFKYNEVNLTSKIKLNLIDPTDNKNFEIKSLSSEEQIIDDTTNTIWNWNVKPISSGENEIILMATIKLHSKNGENSRDVPVYFKKIKVKINIITSIIQFIRNNWQWSVGGIAAIFGFIITTLIAIKSKGDVNAVKSTPKKKK